jgi:predicted DNA-binding transcriptional regulator YafY
MARLLWIEFLVPRPRADFQQWRTVADKTRRFAGWRSPERPSRWTGSVHACCYRLVGGQRKSSAGRRRSGFASGAGGSRLILYGRGLCDRLQLSFVVLMRALIGPDQEMGQGMPATACVCWRVLYVRVFATRSMGSGASRNMSDNSPLFRQWLLLKTLSGRRFGVTVAEMAEELGVTEKTIRRDLKAFCEVGFPIEEQIGDRGRKSWRLKPAGGLTEMSFALDEALALYLGRRFLEPLTGTFLWQAAQRAFKKIRACLGKAALDYLEKTADKLHYTAVGTSDYSRKAEVIDDLMWAIEDHKATHIVYKSLRATEPVTYEVHPYGLTYHRGSLYLVAFSREHDELRHFKVDRIDEAAVSDFPFHMPADFKLDAHLANSFGVFRGDDQITVKIKFLPPVARYVSESKWHESQKLAPQKDGSLLAEFRLSHTEEIKRWLLSFGQHAIVLEPPSLQKETVVELESQLKHYRPVADSDKARATDRISLRSRRSHT